MRKPEPNPEAAAMYDGPSKTQVKREMHELQDLGLALLNLPVAQRDAIAMDERLREALRQYHRMPTREAKRRHMQYVGKLLRDTDSEPARLALEQIRAGETRVLLESERWRERLLAEDEAMTDWVQAHPATEIQPLRTLIRNARRELAALPADAEGTPAARGKCQAYRAVFQVLRAALAAQAMRDRAVSAPGG